MVLKPVLYNHSNPNTFNTYISSRPGNQPSSTYIRATMFSPGETPTEPRTCAVIFSHGETPTNRASTQPHNVAASELRDPLQDEYVFPALSVPTTSHSLLGRVSPFWWEVPTHYPDSSSRCVRPAETASQLGQYPSKTSRTASYASDTQHILWNNTIYTFLSNKISYNTIARRLGCFI